MKVLEIRMAAFALPSPFWYAEGFKPSPKRGEGLQSGSPAPKTGEGAGGCSLLPVGWASYLKTVRSIGQAIALKLKSSPLESVRESVKNVPKSLL